MADIYQNEITKMLHDLNIFTRHERALPIVKNGRVICWNTPARKSPDLTGGLVHQIHVEVKTGKNGNFSFSSWDQGQREYAEKWRTIRGCEYWLAIVVETKDSPHPRVSKVSYLVPYPVMIKIEKSLNGIQKSIPYCVKPGARKAIVEGDLVMKTLLSRFKLDYLPVVKWKIPLEHPFYCMYLNKPSHLYDDFYSD